LQGQYAIAIGYTAGQSTQGQYGICIGANSASTFANTTVLNASGSNVTAAAASAFYIAPIRTADSTGALLIWNPTTKEVQASSVQSSATNKSFVINHPSDNNKYLVHVCLEGPEAGIYYRGKSEITNNSHNIVTLPDYVKDLGSDFTIQITTIFTGKANQVFTVSEVINNQFTVYGENGKFFWLVQGKRGSIEVEPLKSETSVKGNGPYKWI
jgi:hypothetical protein